MGDTLLRHRRRPDPHRRPARRREPRQLPGRDHRRGVDRRHPQDRRLLLRRRPPRASRSCSARATPSPGPRTTGVLAAGHGRVSTGSASTRSSPATTWPSKYGDDLWSELPRPLRRLRPDTALRVAEDGPDPRRDDGLTGLLPRCLRIRGPHHPLDLDGDDHQLRGRRPRGGRRGRPAVLRRRGQDPPARRTGARVSRSPPRRSSSSSSTWGVASGPRPSGSPTPCSAPPGSSCISFLQGLALDAYTSDVDAASASGAICLDSPTLLDDLQAVLTNLGVVHGRITKFNPTYGKSYDEVYAVGVHAKQAGRARSVPRGAQVGARPPAWRPGRRRRTTTPADVVPGITPGRALRARSLPDVATSYGVLLRTEFNFLADRRHHARQSGDGRAGGPHRRASSLPEWLQQVLDDNLHFSPVASVHRRR